MPMRRILLTGANTLTGSHILDRLLQYSDVTVRAVVGSREQVHSLQQQYGHTTRLDFAIIHPRDLSVPGAYDDALGAYPEPFDTVIHSVATDPSEEADCLSRFINVETDTLVNFLRSVKDNATSTRRVILVTSLSPFAHWLVDPQEERSPRGVHQQPSRNAEIDTEYVLATSQASDNIVHDALWKWRRDANAQFDLVALTAPSIYGPSIRRLSNSSDLSEANRRIWNICSSDSGESYSSPPYGIDFYTDVRDLATAAVQAVFIPEAGNRRFVISAGTMPSGPLISDFLIGRFPELGRRVRSHTSPPRRQPTGDPPLEFTDSRQATTILHLRPFMPVEETLTDLTGQILELHRRKEWKHVIHS